MLWCSQLLVIETPIRRCSCFNKFFLWNIQLRIHLIKLAEPFPAHFYPVSNLLPALWCEWRNEMLEHSLGRWDVVEPHAVQKNEPPFQELWAFISDIVPSVK